MADDDKDAKRVTKQHILIVLGTRPEAIKLAPVILAARKNPDIRVSVCNTGQHADMCASVLELFGITPQIDLGVMRPGQTLTELTTSVLEILQQLLQKERPDWVVVQGDTTSAFAASLAAFYQKIPVAHVEAGLRTGDIYSPWPEEMNRKLITGLASLHFPPLSSNAANLRREGVDPNRFVVTGNTGVDALKWLVHRLSEDPNLRQRAQATLDATGVSCLKEKAGARIVLITAHRRESFGAGFDAICHAIANLAARFPERQFVYPVHPNPTVREAVFKTLGKSGLTNVHLIEPLDYLSFVLLMSRVELILTDSGGIQEEAPSLGLRVVVMRALTERGEGIDTGLIRLAGANRDRIVANAVDALTGKWIAGHEGRDVYGDGRASERILAALAGGIAGQPG
jgi:UDP-N-acetylglucosamine 2-epimerase (non-hydrolysing)